MKQYLFMGSIMMALHNKGVRIFFYFIVVRAEHDIYPFKILSAQYSVVNYNTVL